MLAHVVVKHRSWLDLALVSLVSLVTRLVRLGRNPLWVDELYSYQVSLQNLPAILQNSQHESIPPLYYLLLKFSTLSGSLRSEESIRLLSALSGAVFLILFYLLCSQILPRWPAVLIWGFMALSPSLMYYSQEARAYILVLLAAGLSMYIVRHLVDQPAGRPQAGWYWWLAWVFASLLGIYAAYSYFLVLGIQALFLFFVFRFRAAWLASVTLLVAGAAPLAAWMTANLRSDLARTAKQANLTFWDTLQALLGGDPGRYGLHWGSTWLPLVVIVLFGLGLAYWLQKPERFLGYCLAQVGLPLGVWFGLCVPFLGLHMPKFQARQFLALLPALLLCMGFGLVWLSQRLRPGLRPALAFLLSLSILAGSLVGLQKYFDLTKSPEGQAVQFVRDNLSSTDALVSLQYSLTAAVAYYIPGYYRGVHPSRPPGRRLFVQQQHPGAARPARAGTHF